MKTIFLILCLTLFGCLKAKKSPFDMNGGSSFMALAVLSVNSSSNTASNSNTNSFQYDPSSITITKSFPISDLSPKTTITFSSFSVSPSLPTGISINATTGVISGTATSNQAETSYQVTAKNSSITLSTEIKITVTSDPPSNLSYNGTSSGMVSGSTSSVLLFRRTIAASVAPTLTGSATFTVSPSLPSGLSLNSSSGTISGTATISQTASNYIVTATNQYGSTQISLSISVLPVIYAATFGGGLAISTDGGNTFVMRTTGGNNSLDTVSVCSDGTILVSESSASTYKSTNNGTSFSILNTTTSGFVYCDPSNSQNIYFSHNGFANPLYRSTNGGTNFTQLTYGSNNISSMSYSNSVYYTSSSIALIPTGVYKSTDGINFNTIISTATLVYDIVATNAKVYATDGSTVQVSLNSGTSFSSLANISVSTKIAVSANDLNIFVGTTGNGLYVSSNSGSVFNQKTIANGLLSNAIQTVFVDIHGIVYVGSNNGVSISTDNGNTFVTKNNGITNLNIQKIIAQ